MELVLFTRSNCHRGVTEGFVHLQVGSGRGQITAFPRQLESLIRLAEAHAKMRFSNTVDLVSLSGFI